MIVFVSTTRVFYSYSQTRPDLLPKLDDIVWIANSRSHPIHSDMPSIFLKVLVLGVILGTVASSFWTSPATDKKGADEKITDPFDYGVDVTFPIHHYLDSNSYFGKRYAKLMEGCYKLYSKRECDATEKARLEMNFDQPRTQHNYTDIGFKKIKAPKELWDPIIAFYKNYKDKEEPEAWPRGNTYTNNWESKTTMISFENQNLRGGFVAKQQIWNGAKAVIEDWTGKQLVATSLYGIRVYHDGAVLATRK